LEIINYGATIKSLKIPISKSKKINIVLGFDNLSDYVNSFELPSAPYLGSIVGRFAGRINNGEFVLNGKTIQLTKNHKSHQLHGGINGFSKAYWELKSMETANLSSITLCYTSRDNEENFPGEVTTEITYTLTDENELKIAMKATSSEETIINLTQHSYFNLDGHSNTIANQELYINSSKTLETNFDNIPTGRFFSTTDTPFNFKNPKKCPTKIDNTFVLNKDNELAATLYSNENNLKMSVFTNQPAVHIYVGGNCFNQIKGIEESNYHSLSGICFETQNFPDAPNHSHFPNAILKKGETYKHNTSFKFEIL
jgi:aldose 1-epimerase